MDKSFHQISLVIVFFSLLTTSLQPLYSGGVQPKSLEASLVEAIDAGDATRVADLLARGADPLAEVNPLQTLGCVDLRD